MLYVIIRLKPMYHWWYATPQLEKCLTCHKGSWTCLKASQSLSYSHLRYTHTDLHSQTSQDSPSHTCSTSHSPFQPSSFILQSITSISRPSRNLFLLYSKAAPTPVPGSQLASCKVYDLNRTTQINPPRFILSNQHVNLHYSRVRQDWYFKTTVLKIICLVTLEHFEVKHTSLTPTSSFWKRSIFFFF